MNNIERPDVSVITPVSEAIERCKLILFKPFDIGMWFTIGFCAFLATLTGSGSGGHFNTIGNQHGQEIGNFVQTHLALIITIALAVSIFGIIVMLLLLWLSSRGRFMFLHCVAQNKAEVKIPWRQYHDLANNLFVFRLILGLIGFISLTLIICAAGVPIFLMWHNPNIIAIIIIATVAMPIIVILGMSFALVGKFTKNFVVPIMYLRNCGCLAGWKEFLPLFRANVGRFALFLLFQIAIGMAIGAIIIAAACLTCCIAACLMAIPYIGTVLLLPILVFSRSYSLYYLRQYGADFDVFSPAIINE